MSPEMPINFDEKQILLPGELKQSNKNRKIIAKMNADQVHASIDAICHAGFLSSTFYGRVLEPYGIESISTKAAKGKCKTFVKGNMDSSFKDLANEIGKSKNLEWGQVVSCGAVDKVNPHVPTEQHKNFFTYTVKKHYAYPFPYDDEYFPGLDKDVKTRLKMNRAQNAAIADTACRLQFMNRQRQASEMPGLNTKAKDVCTNIDGIVKEASVGMVLLHPVLDSLKKMEKSKHPVLGLFSTLFGMARKLPGKEEMMPWCKKVGFLDTGEDRYNKYIAFDAIATAMLQDKPERTLAEQRLLVALLGKGEN